jgi:hypothetical protein
MTPTAGIWKKDWRRIEETATEVRPALTLALGQIPNYSAKLCRWHSGGNSYTEVFYNQAHNTLLNYVGSRDATIGPAFTALRRAQPPIRPLRKTLRFNRR